MTEMTERFVQDCFRCEGNASHEGQQEQKSKRASSTLSAFIETTGDGSEICAEGRTRPQDTLGLFEKGRQFIGNHIARDRLRRRRRRPRRRVGPFVLQLDDHSLGDGIETMARSAGG